MHLSVWLKDATHLQCVLAGRIVVFTFEFVIVCDLTIGPIPGDGGFGVSRHNGLEHTQLPCWTCANILLLFPQSMNGHLRVVVWEVKVWVWVAHFCKLPVFAA